MDLDSLKDKVSNLTLYDLKAGVRKVQNAVMNYTEMEAKVREATNNEPWGASSSLMQEIANGTYNYQLLNEIMPMIYKRFTEKSAEEWRQIYKALQLLEFLIKNGSERVIDDARSHLSLLKMLRQFHYIDMNGKDQGINVRNRAKELGELLSDVERIRSERKKARATRNKYTGVEGGAGLGFSSNNRYSGFGSETGGYSGGGGYGGFSGGVYGDGGGFGGEGDSGYHGSGSRRDRFEEYDEYDEGAVAAPSRRQADTQRAGVRRETSGGAASKKKEEPPKPKQPEVDLFSFDDPEPVPSASNGKAPATSSAADDFGAMQSGGAADDDDFDDFQSATPAPAAAPAAAAPAPAAGGFGVLTPPPMAPSAQPTQFAAPQPRSGAQASNINDLFSSIHSPSGSISSARQTPATTASSAFAPPPAQQQPAGYVPNQPNYFTSVPAASGLATQQTGGSLGGKGSTPGVLSPTGSIGGAKKPAGGDAFSDLLSGMGTKKPAQSQPKVSMADLAKQKTSSGLWGAPAAASPTMPAAGAPPQGQKTGSALDDLLG